MKYREMCGEKVSALGFGAMRLPLMEDGSIDQAQVEKMTAYAMENGVNYYDTAYPYHNGLSELSIGKALAGYPRESFFLADKFPGHQHMKQYDCKGIFEEQLEKCGVDYFDFYLYHNVCENCFATYTNEEYGIRDYFIEQKKLGKIRHLGLSTHARSENLEEILDYFGDCIEFVQIQLNYVDWELQDAMRKVEIFRERDLPVVVMEPLRGGRLADLGEENNGILKGLRPDESIASWSFRWLQGLPEISVVLSGMSRFDQMKDNVATFTGGKPLSEEEKGILMEIAESMKVGAPCTACRYCTEGCPMELDIPMLIAAYNDLKFQTALAVPMQMDALPADKRPESCIGCGACSSVCPQQIDIPEVMKEFSELLEKAPDWAEMCRQREEAAEKLRAEAAGKK